MDEVESLQEESDARQKAKLQLGYWITLGEPLARTAHRFGYSAIPLFPACLNDKE
jgi:hypothetical protein